MREGRRLLFDDPETLELRHNSITNSSINRGLMSGMRNVFVGHEPQRWKFITKVKTFSHNEIGKFSFLFLIPSS